VKVDWNTWDSFSICSVERTARWNWFCLGERGSLERLVRWNVAPAVRLGAAQARVALGSPWVRREPIRLARSVPINIRMECFVGSHGTSVYRLAMELACLTRRTVARFLTSHLQQHP
jgi:hypothetical protein